jgi:hypothetical protein
MEDGKGEKKIKKRKGRFGNAHAYAARNHVDSIGLMKEKEKVLSIQIQQQSSSARFRQLSAIPVAGWERFFAFFDDAWE